MYIKPPAYWCGDAVTIIPLIEIRWKHIKFANSLESLTVETKLFGQATLLMMITILSRFLVKRLIFRGYCRSGWVTNSLVRKKLWRLLACASRRLASRRHTEGRFRCCYSGEVIYCSPWSVVWILLCGGLREAGWMHYAFLRECTLHGYCQPDLHITERHVQRCE